MGHRMARWRLKLSNVYLCLTERKPLGIKGLTAVAPKHTQFRFGPLFSLAMHHANVSLLLHALGTAAAPDPGGGIGRKNLPPKS